MPFINEVDEKDTPERLHINNNKTKILDIDLSILKKENEFSSRYLFGVHSSIILFSMGMLKLCKKDGFDEKCIEDQKKCIENAKKMFIFCSAIAEEGGNEKDKMITRDLSEQEKEKYKNLETESLKDIKFFVVRASYLLIVKNGQDDNSTRWDNLFLDILFLDILLEEEEKYNNSEKDRFNYFSEFDSHIKILYPHRLTQFSDLGKIFAATCYALLNYDEEDKNKQKYNKLKERLLDQLGKNPKIDENSKEDKSDDNQSYDNDRILGQTEFNGHLETHIRDIQQYFEVYFDSLPKNEDLSVVRDKVVTDIFKIIRGESVRG
jgi:hypothetical protein